MRSARIGILSLTMCAAALLGACADREPVPPSAADLKRLAAEDAKQYTSEEQCLTDFQWPVTTTTIADGTSTWYVNHDLLEALTAGGFAKRTVRYEKKVDKAGAVSQPSFVYELTAVAKPLVRVKSMPQFDGTKADKKILCFGRLSYDGNVEQGMVYVPDDNFMNNVVGFLFHSGDSRYPYYAYRYPDGAVRSALDYSLQTVPSREDFPSAMAKLAGKTASDDAYRMMYESVFRVRNIDVLVRDAGKGWTIEKSEPIRFP
ncbi:hypothetical protein [Ralstonia insidiosa]|jgi:hypothetical protein|nr:hypothetical protein [Ralstonia insidiosa]MBC9968556.1 hypothetical protein [Ralstonia insidiosa]MBX3904623.1 hypothetical protein [Ralstonia insidiosa]